ncbi:MAG: sugar phosphate isomerase/epimerase [Candidatus Bathyarchaeota archaeon]
MKLSLSNGVFSDYSLTDNLSYVKKLGFENIEFNMKTVEQGDEKSVYKIKRLLEKHKLNCLTLHSATFPVTDEIEIPKAIYFGKVSANFANILSAPMMIIHSNVSRKVLELQRKRFLYLMLNEIQSYAKDLNIRLSLENLSELSKSIGKNSVELEEILSVVDGDNIGITLDFCHGETTGQTLNLVEKYKNRLSNVHISNEGHRALESETPNLKQFLMKLHDFRYAGPLTIELKPKCNPEHILKTKSTLTNLCKELQITID